MIIDTEKITISKELRDFVAPLKPDEFYQLENNILLEGCRDPLIVWKKEDQLVLVDGHNRLNICKKSVYFR